MNKFFDVMAGIGILIGIFLFLNKGKETVSIINTLGTNATAGIKTLQGR